MKAMFLLKPDVFNRVYPPVLRDEIRQYLQVEDRVYSAEEIQANPSLLNDVDVIFSSWGMVELNEEILAHAPNLKVVFYGSGTIRYFTPPAFWQRGIRVASAYTVNGEYVAYFTLAQILLSLKRFWYHTDQYKQHRETWRRVPIPGMYRSKIGIISIGAIGRQVCQLLQAFPLEVFAYDPFWTQERADFLGVTLLSLEEIFSLCDVVSLHTPWLPETVGMVTGELLASMKENATFINTSRGAVVREEEMISVLQQRPDLTALLDVTWPEPPAKDSPLFTLPNVVLSPHIAGSIDGEITKMGELMVAEMKRWLAGEPMLNEISEQQAKILA
jgi:phosphoglycerate dehydrogenase-like enzyme